MKTGSKWLVTIGTAGLIFSLIFGVDAWLNEKDFPTFSEVAYDLIQANPTLTLTGMVGFFVVLLIHFIYFPKK